MSPLLEVGWSQGHPMSPLLEGVRMCDVVEEKHERNDLQRSLKA